MDTIVALSSGAGRAGIAVIRITGPHVRFVIETMCRRALEPRRAVHGPILDPSTGAVLDVGILLRFPAPASATGEDVLELHVHGGPALVRDILAAVQRAHPSIRLADPGEFTRRALLNGKLDLLGVEALGELLAAESGGQLEQARRQMSGDLHRRAVAWRSELVDARALIEAHLDFSDEGDVPAGVRDSANRMALRIAEAIGGVLVGAERGRRMREGVRIAILGPPNVGKSSLINALARRDVAIVSPLAGTTRDVVEAHLDIAGWPAILQDTAGLRADTTDEIEREGMRRARATAAEADLVLNLSAPDVGGLAPDPSLPSCPVLDVRMKSDLAAACAAADAPADACEVSALTGEGLEELVRRVGDILDNRFGSEPALVSHERQIEALRRAADHLQCAASIGLPELAAEDLRLASRELGRFVGDVDLDGVLDRLFAGFCIGK